MKRSVVLALVFVLALSAVSFGAVQDFGKFTIDVPAGWTATHTGPTASITKNDNTAALSVTVDSAQGNSAGALAAAFVESFKGSFKSVSEPKADSDGDYSWDMVNAQDVNTHAMLHVAGGNYVLITMTGVENAADDMSAILDSIKEK